MRSLNSSPDESPSASALIGEEQQPLKVSARLLELRTANGPVYLQPGGWQRFWLQRAFRHFRVLPPQLLGTRNQRRIEALLATSVVRPNHPVTSDEIFGVVAQVHARSPIPTSKAEKAPASPQKSLVLVRERKPVPFPQLRVTPAKPVGSVLQEGGLWQWVVAALCAGACIPLIMASVYGVSTLSSKPEVSVSPQAAPAEQTSSQASPSIPAASSSAAVPAVEKHRRRVFTAAAHPVMLDAATPPESAVAEHRFVSVLPPGHFARPNRTGSLAGEVRLKATIGSDGYVKQVTVLSGDPRLAQAAMRAVMRWHYSPNGDPVAAETEIRMKFFGSDGVSIASVAGPKS